MATSSDQQGSRPPEATSLVTPPQRNAHSRPLIRCPHSILFMHWCSHLNRRWVRKPCHRWRCQACGITRLYQELLPEIALAYRAAADSGWTLKLITLPWWSGDVGSQDSPAGQKRRRLDLAHFKQALKRDNIRFDYLRVVELHKAGTVHLHLLVVCPYIRQADLSTRWQAATRGSSIVDIQPIGFKCPRCWDSSIKNRKLRRQRIIVLVPGHPEAICSNCALSVPAADAIERTVKGALWEIGKYLVKYPVGKLTRSKGWLPFHSQALAILKQDNTKPACSHCPKPHRTMFYTERRAEEDFPDEYMEIAIGLPGHPFIYGKCDCWHRPPDLAIDQAYLALYPT